MYDLPAVVFLIPIVNVHVVVVTSEILLENA